MNSYNKKKHPGVLGEPRKPKSMSVPPKRYQIVPTVDSPVPGSTNRSQEPLSLARIIPVIGSKYLDVWRRVKIKIRAQLVIKKLLLVDRPDAKKPEEEKYLVIRKGSRVFDNGVTEVATIEITPWYIIHPKNKLKNIWNVILAILLLYTVTLMPFALAFINSSPGDIWDIIDLTSDGFFFIDFVVNCFSAYYDKTETLISSFPKIIKNYMKTWMFIDIISFFPFTLLDTANQQTYYSTGNYNNLIRLLRLPKIYRLLRISRLLKLLKSFNSIEIIEKIQEYFSIKNSAMRLIKSFFVISVCLHLASCLWYFSSKLDGFGPDTWVVRYGYLDNDMGTKYLTSLYWAFTTLCTVGYGEISGYTSLEKSICIIWMVCGLYFFSFTIGSLSSMMSSIDTKENVLLSKLAVIDEFSIEANLNKDLRNKLKHALRYSSEKRGFSWLDKLSIFNELPKPLRYEVAINMHHGAAKELSFFKDKDQTLIAAIVPLLQPMFVERNDHVYKKGEFADEIYFIVRGRISYVFGKEETILKSMQKGSYFGDIEVIQGIGRKYSAKGIRSSELLIMHKQVIQEIIEEHPSVWEEIKTVALEREKINEKSIVEIQELIRLRNNDELESINVKVFRKKVEELFEKRCQHLKEKNHVFTLKDLAQRIDVLSRLVKKEDINPSRKKTDFSEDDLD